MLITPEGYGVLFDVGHVLLDEVPRLESALTWLEGALGAQGIEASAGRLRDLYRRACLDPTPGEESLIVQAIQAAGGSEALARRIRQNVPWDAVPMPPRPDAVSALRVLADAGVRLGVLANQPASTIDDLQSCAATRYLDEVWLSEAVGLRKPDPAFFQVALDRWKLPAHRVAYVGDRPDNDIGPAHAVGMYAVRLRLGPHADQPAQTAEEEADFEVWSLTQAAEHLCSWARGEA